MFFRTIINDTVEKAIVSIINRTMKKFSYVRFFDFEYKKVLNLLWWKGGTFCFLIQKSAIASII
ncbi:hypothetical protein ACL98_04500 [Staphylococcus aureus]|nr:hypothetical protein BZK09_14640 [Staphylococcus aureus]OLR33262.1 hypothetical protein WG79_01880 [Staphylococcus aureus subsp. aureus ST398]OCQ35548.1 hypothetical protein A6762_08705 [Staphylococcus aureus]PAG60817.1 hypothetical protein APV56_06125 [Staphylococcus aureus]PBI76713.1 hypothetical protein APX02_02255 [Staphylococcus aureus]